MSRSLSRRFVAPLALLAALAMAFSLLAGTAEAGTATGTPVVGECHDYGWKAALKRSETSAPVGCDQAHTARVIAVGDLADGKDWSDYTVDQLDQQVSKVCYPALYEALGRTHKVRDLTAYSYFWYTPTKAQRQAGARWFRCDVALQGGQKLLALPTDEVPALPSGKLPKSVKRCTDADGFFTTCDRKHAYRATGDFTMHVSKYPSDGKLQRIAVDHCPKLVTSRSWWWTTAGRSGFRQGDRVMVCYSKTKH